VGSSYLPANLRVLANYLCYKFISGLRETLKLYHWST